MAYDPSLGYDPRGYEAPPAPPEGLPPIPPEMQTRDHLHCRRCGAVVADPALHSRYHEAIDR